MMAAMEASLTARLTPYTDEELARACARGETDPFAELVLRYSTAVYAFCLRMTGCAEDAEDLTQEVFLQLLRVLPRARTDMPLRPWIFVIARNKCLDHLKRRRPLPFTRLSAAEAGALDVPDAALSPEERLEQDGLQEAVQRAIAALPERYRAVVALRYTTDLTFGEIGQVLGLPENTVKTHFQRAKALLRAELARFLRE
jgi:RNA polymerase sigma-70 factor (ECF subfamily)